MGNATQYRNLTCNPVSALTHATQYGNLTCNPVSALTHATQYGNLTCNPVSAPSRDLLAQARLGACA
jgi:hypothetical protein